MSGIASVCIYCGAQNAVAPEYLSLAREVGTMLARKGITVIYGGGGTGMMGALADGALAEGGNVIGIVPQNIAKLEALHKGAVDLRMVDTMHTRKLTMFELADAVIVLPGGIGTLDEFFEVLTWKQLGIHAKPIILLNANRYWDGLLSLLNQLVQRHFSRPSMPESFQVVNDVKSLMAATLKI